nr:hypothetical protein [Angustibacter aerolatus]
MSSRYAYATGGYTGDVLIVLSLRGGFDGLSAVAPVNDPDYQKPAPDHPHPGLAGHPGSTTPSACTRPSPPQALLGRRQLRRRARGGPGVADPLALPGDGRARARGAGHRPAHRLARPHPRPAPRHLGVPGRAGRWQRRQPRVRRPEPRAGPGQRRRLPGCRAPATPPTWPAGAPR